MKNIALKVMTEINAPVAKVWEAITKPEVIKHYFFGTDTITDWKVGSPVSFQGVYHGKQYRDNGTVLEVNPNKTLRYNYWSPMSGIEDKPENYVPRHLFAYGDEAPYRANRHAREYSGRKNENAE